jgi:hypothetical protein
MSAAVGAVAAACVMDYIGVLARCFCCSLGYRVAGSF